MELKTKVLANVALSPTDDPYTFSARVTTGCLDRQDEIVIPDGIDLSKFMQSGFWTFQHDYTLVPCAYPDKSKKVVRTHDYLELSGRFLERPENHVGEYWPDTVRDYVTQFTKAGIQPGVSIGFKTTEARKPTKLDRATCYKNCLAKGMSEEEAKSAASSLDAVISKCELLEVSFAIIPANPEAVITSVGKGLITKAAAEFAGVKVPDDIEVKFVPEDTHPNCKCEIKNDTWITQPGCCDKCEGLKNEFNELQGDNKTLVLTQMEQEEGDLHSRFAKAKEKHKETPKVEEKKTIHMLVVLPSKSVMDRDSLEMEFKKQMAKSWGRNYLSD